MQRYTTIGLLSAIVLSVGILGVYGFNSIPSTLQAQSDAQTIGAVPMLGHVTMTVTDPKGNILAYHQGDNVVVNQAEDCLSSKVFGIKTTDGGSGCGTYNVIVLGNHTGAVAAKTNSTMDAEITTGPGLGRQTASTQTVTQATSGSPVSDLLQATFTNGGTTDTVTEAGLFNSTVASSVGMFAHQAFTGVALNNGDSLTVKWTVTMGT
jgi:hypothetical protein